MLSRAMTIDILALLPRYGMAPLIIGQRYHFVDNGVKFGVVFDNGEQFMHLGSGISFFIVSLTLTLASNFGHVETGPRFDPPKRNGDTTTYWTEGKSWREIKHGQDWERISLRSLSRLIFELNQDDAQGVVDKWFQ